MYLRNNRLIVLIAILSFLSLTSCEIAQLNDSKNSNDSKNDKPKVENFASSKTFKDLVNITEKTIRIQSEHFRSLDKEERKTYQNKLQELTSNLSQNESKENLMKFVDHSGFKSLDQYLGMIERQQELVKNLRAEYPGFANLEKKEQKKLLREGTDILQRKAVDKESMPTMTSCSSELENKKKQILSTSTQKLVGCGAAGAAASSVGTPLGGGVVYGICAGAVYAEMNAKLDQAQAEYEECISS